MLTKILIMTLLAASGGDAYTTRDLMNRGGVEHDPLARPFVNHGVGVQIATTGALAAGTAILAWKLSHKHPHEVDAGLLAGTAVETYFAIQNAEWKNPGIKPGLTGVHP